MAETENPWTVVASTIETPTKQKTHSTMSTEDNETLSAKKALFVTTTDGEETTPLLQTPRKRRRVLRDEDFWSSGEEYEEEEEEDPTGSGEDLCDTVCDSDTSDDSLQKNSSREEPEQRNVDFFRFMSNALDISTQELEMMKRAFEAGEKFFDCRPLGSPVVSNSKFGRWRETDELHVNEAFRAFLTNEETTLGASQTNASTHFQTDLDAHVRKSAMECIRPVDLKTGARISGFYGPLTGSYKTFGGARQSSPQASNDVASTDGVSPEKGGSFSRYLLERTFMVKKPRSSHEIWQECFVVAVRNTGIKSFVKALPLTKAVLKKANSVAVSGKRSKAKKPKRPKRFRESHCFWTTFNENFIVEKNDNSCHFVQVHEDANAFVKKENVSDLEAARAARDKVQKRAKKAALSRKRRREMMIVKNMMMMKNPDHVVWNNLQRPGRSRSTSCSSITGGHSPRSAHRGRPIATETVVETPPKCPVVNVSELKPLLMPMVKPVPFESEKASLVPSLVPSSAAKQPDEKKNVESTPSPLTPLDVPWMELHAK